MGGRATHAIVAVLLAVALAGCGLYTQDPDGKPRTHRHPTGTASLTSTGSALPKPRPTARSSSHLSAAELRRRGCHPGDPRAGVNTPLRLIVKNPCLTVHGVVGCIFTDQGDGDTHLALSLDPGEQKYLTPGNRVWTCARDQRSDTEPRMVVEVIPQHCIARPDNCADRGHFKTPPIPPEGSHVTITGAWVLDTSTRHGATLWSEIHPAFRIVVDNG